MVPVGMVWQPPRWSNPRDNEYSLMSKTIRVSEYGAPEVMQWTDATVASPGPGEVTLRHTAIGINFIDTYQRSGLYKLPLPFTPGQEGAGVVEAVGPGVTEFKPGDRVGYQGIVGAYTERRNIAADHLVPIPDGIDDKTAAAALLKGLTAYFLVNRTFKVGKGTTMLLHAAAGGVGLLACQWGKALGATVIGTVGSEEKAELARAIGCDHVINYRTEDFVAGVKALTNGGGVDVAYDSVGKDTFPGSLDCLKPTGLWVSFGQSSGPVPPFAPLLLMEKGSLFATRPTIRHYIATRPQLLEAAAQLFAVIANGTVKVKVGQEFPLAEAVAAHHALHGRQTVGATLLIP